MRPGEEIDAARLSAWLGQPVLAIEQFPGGHSNLTYRVRTPDAEFVLRRPPIGPVAPKAHDMARESRVLQALAPVFPPAPRVLGLCEDAAVIGAPFFLMELRHGIVLRAALPPELEPHAGAISEAFLATLVQLHSLDISAFPLGKPDGFLQRQVEGWSGRWRRAQTTVLPGIDEAIVWLERNLPRSPTPVMLHNDYKLDNLMLDAADPGRVTALLDWEMATLGDPLADLGLALTYWNFYPLPGVWPRDRLVQEYALRSGRDVGGLAYYEVLGVFKLAVILQQIYFRFVQGQTRDERFRAFGPVVERLADRCRELMARA
jgi:aminoglycoside phosphotransferase (APT) family kinase protein